MQWTPPPPEALVPHLAGWWYRVGATLIDAVVVGVVATFVDLGVHTAAGRLAVQLLAGIVYATLLIGQRGQTLGMMAVGTRAVDAATGTLIGPARALGRVLVGDLLGITVIGGILDLLWPLWDRRNQTLHDKAAGTVVVLMRPQRAPESPPAGWYADPGGSGLQRWWDGRGWTQQTHPPG